MGSPGGPSSQGWPLFYSDEFVTAFRELFDGRRDAHGAYGNMCVRGEVTDALIRRHLDGEQRVGIYTIAGAELDRCKWGCLDVDFDDWTFVQLAAKRLEQYGLPTIVEKTKSKGWHVWIVFSGFVIAWKVKAVLELVLHDLDDELKLREKTHIDIFPRQSRVPKGGFGNYVNLPLFGRDAIDGRTCFYIPDADGKPSLVKDWSPSTVAPCREAALDELVELGTLKPDLVRPRAQPQSNGAAAAVGAVDPNYGRRYTEVLDCANRVLKEGVGEGARNKWAFRLPIHLKHAGLNEGDCRKVMAEWNGRNRPPLDQRELHATIKSAFDPKHLNDSYGCDDPAIAHYCSLHECPVYRRDHPGPSTSTNGSPEVAEKPTTNAEGVPATASFRGYEERTGTYEFSRGTLIYKVSGVDNRNRNAALVGRLEILHLGKHVFANKVNIDGMQSRRAIDREVYDKTERKVTGVSNDLMDVSVGIMQRLTAEAQKAAATEAASRAGYVMSDKEKEEAKQFALDHPFILKDMIEFTSKHGITREKPNRCALTVMFASRLMQNPISGIGKGDSSSGKSRLAENMLKLVPPEDVFDATRMTPAALYYLERGSLKNKVVYVREAHGGDDSEYTIRTFISEKDLRLLTVEKNEQTGKNETRNVVIDGPICFYTTTTAVEVHAENETRLTTITADETESTTAAIRDVSAYNAQFGAIDATDDDLTPWRNFQRILGRGKKVLIPYATELTDGFPTQNIRSRRDFPRMLEMIKACAYLHQFHRDHSTTLDSDLRAKEEVIYASVADYQIVKSIMEESIMRIVKGVKPGQEALLLKVQSIGDNAIAAYGEQRTVDHTSVERQEDGSLVVWVDAPLLRERLGKTQAAVNRLIRALEADGSLVTSPKGIKPVRVRIAKPISEEVVRMKLDTIAPERLYEKYPNDRRHAYDPLSAPDFEDLYGSAGRGWRRTTIEIPGTP